MEIDISKVYGDLMYVASKTGPLEFIGNLFAEREPDRIVVYDFVLLSVGSAVYSEIKPELMLPLSKRPDAHKMHGMCHMHPVGNGVPGEHNWSGTDREWILETPLGSLPQLVKWSFSIVLTPGGWVGRVDNYLTGKTLHCPVVYFRPEIAAKAQALTPERTPAAFELAQDWRRERLKAFHESGYLLASGEEEFPLEFLEEYFSMYPDEDLADFARMGNPELWELIRADRDLHGYRPSEVRQACQRILGDAGQLSFLDGEDG